MLGLLPNKEAAVPHHKTFKTRPSSDSEAATMYKLKEKSSIYANWPRLHIKRTGPSSWSVQLVCLAGPSSWSD